MIMKKEITITFNLEQIAQITFALDLLNTELGCANSPYSGEDLRYYVRSIDDNFRFTDEEWDIIIKKAHPHITF
jgi:hypothetical protein